MTRWVPLLLVLSLGSGCASTSAMPRFAAAPENAPAHEAQHHDAGISPLGMAGLVGLGALTAGFAAVLIFVVPQTHAGG